MVVDARSCDNINCPFYSVCEEDDGGVSRCVCSSTCSQVSEGQVSQTTVDPESNI